MTDAIEEGLRYEVSEIEGIGTVCPKTLMRTDANTEYVRESFNSGDSGQCTGPVLFGRVHCLPGVVPKPIGYLRVGLRHKE